MGILTVGFLRFTLYFWKKKEKEEEKRKK